MERQHIEAMHEQLIQLQTAAQRLKALGQTHQMPAAVKNAERILACAQMLSLHISDPLELLEDADQ